MTERRRYRRHTSDRSGRRIGEKVQCPRCKGLQSRVLPDKLRIHREDGYHRQRQCSDCEHIFSTVETVCDA